MSSPDTILSISAQGGKGVLGLILLIFATGKAGIALSRGEAGAALYSKPRTRGTLDPPFLAGHHRSGGDLPALTGSMLLSTARRQKYRVRFLFLEQEKPQAALQVPTCARKQTQEGLGGWWVRTGRAQQLHGEAGAGSVSLQRRSPRVMTGAELVWFQRRFGLLLEAGRTAVQGELKWTVQSSHVSMGFQQPRGGWWLRPAGGSHLWQQVELWEGITICFVSGLKFNGRFLKKA